MATQDLKQFIESRILAVDPSADLEPGSPHQLQLVAPILDYLGADPLETDVEKFILDRYSQEYPAIYAENPGAIRDAFVNPLRLFLEPLRREIQIIKRGQTMRHPELLSEEDAEALAANLFVGKDSGGFASGTARVFFPNPVNVQVEVSTRFFGSSGLSFFPTNPTSITAEQMIFNRDGTLYYLDIPVRAEKEGPEYNIDENGLSGVEGLFGVVKVTNPHRFQDGLAKVDTPTFLATAKESLTERSLVTPRGAVARTREEFQTSVRAVQVIGARDVEMQRDILVAASPGHAWLTGRVHLFRRLGYVQCRTIDGGEVDLPSPGDQLYIYLDKTRFPGVAQEARFIRVEVAELLLGPLAEAAPFQASFVVRWSGVLPAGVSSDTPISFEGGLAKKGNIRVSSLPDVGPVSFVVPNGEVHLYGHTDIYVRPISQPSSKAIFSGLNDEGSFIERLSLSTFGTASTGKNRVVDGEGLDFGQAGVRGGDMLVIETGDDQGTYSIGRVDGGVLYLTSNLTGTLTGLRYRVIQRLRINPFAVRIPKIPFGSVTAGDLSTTIGSKLFRLMSNDAAGLGVRTGDTLRILQGGDQGDYLITGFDPVLGGRGLLVDRAAGATNANLAYEIFTAMESLQRPLVRIKEVQVLDTAKQSTGVVVPPAEPLAVVPQGSFTSARVRGASQARSGYVLPNLQGLLDAVNLAAPSGDRRFSLGFDDPQGTYKSVVFEDDSYAEFPFHDRAQAGCSYFLCTSEHTDEAFNRPPVDPRPGECLTIKTGPNQGSYLIQNVYPFNYKVSGGRVVQLLFLEILGTFPADPLRELIDFISAQGVTLAPLPQPIPFPGFFRTFFEDLADKLGMALAAAGASLPPSESLEKAVQEMSQVEYEWGDPARGVLRIYFAAPTLFEEFTAGADEVTLFSYLTPTGEEVLFRPDPSRYTGAELVPAPTTADGADPLTYPRDLDASIGGQVTLSDPLRASAFALGIGPGDVLSVHEEVFLHGASKTRQMGVQTLSGSPRVTTAPTAPAFPQEVIGSLFFIEEGLDAGSYRVTARLNDHSLVLDRALSSSTPALVLDGAGASWGFDGTVNKLVATGAPFLPIHVGMYLTLYGMDTRYQGSYQVKALLSLNSISVERTGDFPAYPADAGLASWILTEAPLSPPARTGLGTELVGLRPVRMYESAPEEVEIEEVVHDDVSLSRLFIPLGLRDGEAQPYRIYRKDLRRVTPAEMEENVEGNFVYVDTEVVSLTASPAANLSRDVYLTLVEGTYRSHGYRHVVEDPSFSYSTLERGYLEFPTRLLPPGSPDTSEAFLNLVGTPIQVTYERAEVVERQQEFLESPQDRVTVANMLARHFLPAYVSYEARYTGGSSPAVIAKDIISYIDSLPAETALDVSEIEQRITQRGGNPETPTRVMAVIHDWDRRMWLEMSSNELGGTRSKVPYHGTSRVTYYIPGPDASSNEIITGTERIRLIRR
jgi:hypothetical protein